MASPEGPPDPSAPSPAARGVQGPGRGCSVSGTLPVPAAFPELWSRPGRTGTALPRVPCVSPVPCQGPGSGAAPALPGGSRGAQAQGGAGMTEETRSGWENKALRMQSCGGAREDGGTGWERGMRGGSGGWSRGRGSGAGTAVGHWDTSVLPSLEPGQAWEGSTANPTSAMPRWGLVKQSSVFWGAPKRAGCSSPAPAPVSRVSNAELQR